MTKTNIRWAKVFFLSKLFLYNCMTLFNWFCCQANSYFWFLILSVVFAMNDKKNLSKRKRCGIKKIKALMKHQCAEQVIYLIETISIIKFSVWQIQNLKAYKHIDIKQKFRIFFSFIFYLIEIRNQWKN